jgi:anti-anti-sigma regulatory factor
MSCAVSPVLRNPEPGSHVCWVVEDDASYVERAAAVLREARASGDKPLAFGAEGSSSLAELAPLAAVAADPRAAFLGGGPLEPDVMFAMFEEQSAIARGEGYRRLCLVADMDWLLPLQPSTASVVAFELLLDRHAKRLDATIVCAYRRASFDAGAVAGTMAVHPVAAGVADPPQFRLVAAGDGTWALSGELDLAVTEHFSAAIHAATAGGDGVVDVSGLDFIDVGGMRAIADAGRSVAAPIRLLGATPRFRRSWKLAGFADLAPMVELVG